MKSFQPRFIHSVLIAVAVFSGSLFFANLAVYANGEGGFWSGMGMSAQVNCSNPSSPTVRLDWQNNTGDVYYFIARDGAAYAGGRSYGSLTYTDTNVNPGYTYSYWVDGYTAEGTQNSRTSVTVTVQCSSPRSADFTVNGQTSIIATFDTYLDFEGKQQGNVGCDLNLYKANNEYVGPYKRGGGAGVSFGGTNADGTIQLTFTGQDGTFNSSDYGLNKIFAQPYGGYNFVLKCSDGSGVDLVRSVYVDFSPPPPANITVNGLSSCSSAGLTWSLTPGSLAGSYPSGSYTVTPATGGTTYTVSPRVSSGYTAAVSNSDGGGSSMLVYGNQNKTFSVQCTTDLCNPPPSPSTQTLQCPSGTGTYTQTTTYTNGPAPSCTLTSSVTDNQASACSGTPLPACRIDSFPTQYESGGVVYPTWATTYSNNVVLSGGQFGSGVVVEPDGSRAINISSNTLLTITANAGSTCSPSASASAWMYAESVSMCTVPGKEYLQASDPNCKPDVPSCSFVNPYDGSDGFPDFGETGDGYTNIFWYSNASSLTLSGGPYSNYPVSAPNSSGYFYFPNITANTTVVLTGNNGQCSNTSIIYAAAVPPAPSPFTATPQGCGTGQINLSWGESPGSYNYIVYRDGTQIYSGPEWNPYGWNIKSDVGLAPGSPHSYSVIGESPNGRTSQNVASANAPVACPVPATVTLSANPSTVAYGAASTLTWSSSNATSCTASDGSAGWSGAKATAGNQSTGNLTTNTTYTITCTGPGGNSTPKSVTVTVNPPPPSSPTGFTVSPTSCGNNWLSLSWYPPSTGTATNYKVYRDGGGIPIYNGTGADIQLGEGAMGFSDTGLVAGSSHNYTVTASNAYGTSAPASGSGIVTANCTPTASLSADSPNVAYNTATTLRWSSTNATSCTASGGSWNGPQAISGSVSTGNLTSNTTYTLTCTNTSTGINSTPVSTTVTVGAAPMSGTLTPATPSCTIAAGNSSCNIDFSWTTLNPVATSVVTKPVNVTVASGNSGTNVPFAVKYNTETFYLYNNGIELANRAVTSDCASGSSWNGSICYSAPAFDYTLSSPGSVSVTRGGGSQQKNISTVAVTGSQRVDIINTTSSMPTGLSAVPSVCTPEGVPCTSTITIAATSAATAGTYDITFFGSPAGASTVAKTLSVTVQNPTGVVVTCAVNKSTANVGESVGWSSSVSGGIPPYTSYAWSGSGVPSPAPTSSSFSTTYSTTGTKTAQVTVTDSVGGQGTCTPVSTLINFDPTIIEF
jgi:hypothetical protein